MTLSGKTKVPFMIRDGKKWLLLNKLDNAGLLRAVRISKKRHVHDFDGHHCDEVAAKGSIRYYPKKMRENN